MKRRLAGGSAFFLPGPQIPAREESRNSTSSERSGANGVRCFRTHGRNEGSVSLAMLCLG
jgi:hypothetical protein